MDPLLKKALFRAVEKEPFARAMGLCLVSVEEGHAIVEMTYEPEKMNNLYARAHGGAIFSLIDEAFQVACQTHGTITVALNVNTTYISSPNETTRLRAVASEISKTRKTASYEIRVFDSSDRLIASCQAVAYRTGKPIPFV
jgi:acyl-CoA thioesterase